MRVNERTAETTTKKQELTAEVTGRKKAEAAVRETDQKYRTIFDSNSTGIAITTLDGKVVDANQTYQDMVGYTLKELEGTNAQELTPKKWHKFEAEATKHLMSEGYGTSEKEYIKKDGTIFPVSVSAWLIRDRQGNPAGIGTFVTDVTEQKKAEEALRRTTDEQATILSTVPAMIFWIDRECNFMRVNEAFAGALHTSPDDVKGKSLFDLYPEDMARRYYDDNMEVMESSTPKMHIEESVQTPAGTMWVRTDKVPLRDEQGNSIGIIGFSVDITDRKAMGKTLGESEEKYRTQFEGALDAIFIADAETGILVDCNRAACKLVGRKKSELVGQHQRILHPPQEKNGDVTRTFKQHLGEKEGQVVETQVITKKGEIKDVAIKANVIELRGKKLFQGIFRDITERKQAEEETKSERDKLKALVDGLGSTGIGIDIVGIDYKVLYQNRLLQERFGDVTGKLCYEEYVGLKKPCDVCPMMKAVRSGSVENVELTGVDGRTYDLISAPIPNPDGTVDKAIEVILDVTERKRSEEALQEAKTRFEAMFETANELIITTDAEGWILRLNKEVEKHTGYSRKELIGQSILEIAYPEDRDKYVQFWQDILSGLSPHYELRTISKTGNIRHLLASGNAIRKDGNIVEIQYNAKDITEEKQAEEKLRESEEKYRTILESVTEGYYELDLAGNLAFFNDSLCQTLGYTRNEMMGMNNRQYMDEENARKVYQIFNEIYRTGKPCTRADWESIRKDGTKLSISSSVSLITDSQGKPIGFRGLLRDITQQKQAEEELRQSEEKHRTILENVVEGYYEVDLAGNFTFVNDAVCNDTGYSRDELIGMNNRDYMDKQTARKVYQKFGEVYTTGETASEFGFEVIRKDGTKLSSACSISLIRDAEGQPIGFRGVIRDITEQKQAKEALRQSEEEYKSLFERATDAVFTTDMRSRFTSGNRKAEEICGYNREELIGKSFTSLISKKELPRLENIFQEIIKGKPATFEVAIKDKSGNLIPLEISATSIVRKGEETVGMLAMARDITERRQAQEKLQKSEEQYRSLFETATDGIFTMDLQTKFTSGNRRAEEMCGYSRDELIGEYATLILPEEAIPRVADVLKKVLKGETDTYETRIITKNGELLPVEVTSSPIEIDGKIIGTMGMARDITERKRAEEELRESEKKYRTILESITEGYYELDLAGNFTFFNDATCKMLGYTRDKLMGMNNREYMDKENAGKVYKVFNKVYTTGKPAIGIDWEIIRKDGTKRFTEASASLIRNKEGKPTGFRGVTRNITERKQAEQVLRESEEKYRQLTEEINDAIYTVDQDGNLTYVSPVIEWLIGYSPSEIMGRSFAEFFYEEDLPRAIEGFERTLSGHSTEGEYRFHTKSGEIRWMGTSNRPIFAGDGVVGTRGTMTDITERKLAEQASQEAKTRFEDLFESANELIITTDTEGWILHVNKEVERFSGYSKKELIGQSILKIAYPEDTPKYIQFWKDILDGLTPRYHLRGFSRTGNISHLLASASVVKKDGNIVEIQYNAKDITEEEQAEERLRESEKKYRTILENMTDGYYEIDIVGNLTFFNDSLCQILGYTRDVLMGMNNRKYMDKENARKVYQIFNKVYTTGKPVRDFDYEVIRKDGTKRFIEASASLVRNPQGEPRGFRGVGRDITERKQMEAEKEELQQRAQLASRLSVVGEMASGIVHEVNNPLTSVIGFAEMLAHKDLPEDAKEYARIINNEGKRVANIAGRLLNFARHQKPETVHTDINKLIEDTLKLQNYEMTTGNIKVTANLDPHLPQTMADPGQLQQVFLNIMLNARTAVRAAHGGGRLLVKTQALDDTIRISIKDDGPGIPKENLKRIFNPFFTTRKAGEGTGLGLSLCQGIISSHKGKIYAESTLGKGATFIIELPVVARQKNKARTARANGNNVWR